MFDRNSGQFIKAVPYTKVTWTKGIDPKTGQPVDYDAEQGRAGLRRGVERQRRQGDPQRLPEPRRRQQLLARHLQPEHRSHLHSELEGCDNITNDHARHVKGKFDGGGYVAPDRLTGSIVAVDPTTGEKKMRKELPYPIFGGTLSTAGGLVMTGLVDGTLVALDDKTLDELWSLNVGTGFNAPPMTYSVDGKQYVAIASGLFRNARNSLSKSPEMRNLSNATMVFVFGL